jgi:hypothetical protein
MSVGSWTISAREREAGVLVREYRLVPYPADEYWNELMTQIETWQKSDTESEHLPPPIF